MTAAARATPSLGGPLANEQDLDDALFGPYDEDANGEE